MNEAVFFLLGSNLGAREQLLSEAFLALKKMASDAAKVCCSPVYETAAWGLEAQPAFLNMAVGMQVSLQALEVLQEMGNIEAKWGRQRTLKWGPRSLDIDLLLWGEKIIRTEQLHVPHPRLPERRFALAPLADIAGACIHPEYGQSIAALLAACPDPLSVTCLGTLEALLAAQDA